MYSNTPKSGGADMSKFFEELVSETPKSSGVSLKLVPVAEPDKPLAAVIITFCEGHSYDKLYSVVPQKHPDGAVHVWRAGMNSETICAVTSLLDGKPTCGVPFQFVDDIDRPDSNITINFECCTGCSQEGFLRGARDVLGLTKLALDKGLMVMFSDFSLKALIAKWDESLFGPKAFQQIGIFAGHFILRFDPEILKQCTLSQLQVVGELGADEGRAIVDAFAETIIFTLSGEAESSTAYTVEILTVQTSWGDNVKSVRGIPAKIGDHIGTIGHAVLTYPTGGQLVASSGHWFELSRIDVASVDTVIKVGRSKYGDEYATAVETDLASCKTDEERDCKTQKYVRDYVGSSPGYLSSKPFSAPI